MDVSQINFYSFGAWLVLGLREPFDTPSCNPGSNPDFGESRNRKSENFVKLKEKPSFLVTFNLSLKFFMEIDHSGIFKL